MNSSISNQNQSLIYKSIAQLEVSLMSTLVAIFFASLATTTSLLTFFVILKTKRFRRSKFFILLLASVVCDSVLGVSYLIFCSKRFYRYYSGVGEIMTRWSCFEEFCVNAYAHIFSLAVSVALVVDRLNATCRPIRYKLTTLGRWTLPLVVSAVLYAMIQLGVHAEDAWKNASGTVLTCTLQSITSPEVLDRLTTAQLVTSCTVVGLNVILAVMVWLRTRKAKTEHGTTIASSSSSQAHKMDTKIFKTITVMTTAHGITHLGGRLLQVISSAYIEESTQMAIFRYSRTLVVLNAGIHFFLLCLTSADFRKAADKYFCGFWRRAQISPS